MSKTLSKLVKYRGKVLNLLKKKDYFLLHHQFDEKL